MFKPLLAAEAELDKLKFPVIASPKLDGIRATFQNGFLVTRSLKPIPNRLINSMFQHYMSLDGELIAGPPQAKDVFRTTTSVVMSHNAPIDNVQFYVFDLVDERLPFIERLKSAAVGVEEAGDRFWNVPHMKVLNLDDLLILEERTLADGYEGLMLRDPNGRYKYGRSTVSEGILLKLKRKLTSTAEIIGWEERMHNANPAKVDALGYTERSSHQANLVPMGTLGAVLARDLKSGVEFNVGTGWTDAERQEIWDSRETKFGACFEYEYLPIGVKDKPRHPVFKGWRDRRDIS